MKIKIDGIRTSWLATLEITDEEIDNISKGVDELIDLSDLEFEAPELKALIDLSDRLEAARNIAIAQGY